MIEKIISYIKTLFVGSGIGIYTAIFVIIYFLSYLWNGAYNTHFDLVNLRDTYMFVLSQLNITHGINSLLNSPKGEMPNQQPNQK